MHATARRHARLSAANAAEAIRAILTLPLPQALTLALTPSLSLTFTLPEPHPKQAIRSERSPANAARDRRTGDSARDAAVSSE